MSILTDAKRNKLMHLENTLLMYRIYNAETLERLAKMVHALHSRQSLYESLFAGKTSAAFEAYSQMHGACGIQHYAVLIQCYICIQLKINILEFIMNLFHNYIYIC